MIETSAASSQRRIKVSDSISIYVLFERAFVADLYDEIDFEPVLDVFEESDDEDELYLQADTLSNSKQTIHKQRYLEI